MIVDNPGGLGFRIEHVWAFLAVGEDDDEGIIAIAGRDGLVYTMIAADPSRLEQLRPMAETMAKVGGTNIVLARFEKRVDLETFE